MKPILFIAVVLHVIVLSTQTSVYHFSNFPTNWFEANLICRQSGYQLAVIDSADKQAQIELKIHSLSMTNRAFWLSGTNLAEAHQWSWMSNGLPLNYTNWLAEPTTADVKSCLRITPHRGQQWQAFPCDLEQNFVCEEIE